MKGFAHLMGWIRTRHWTGLAAWALIAVMGLAIGLLIQARTKAESRQRSLVRSAAGKDMSEAADSRPGTADKGVVIPCLLDSPSALAVDESGRIFVGGEGQVVMLAADGSVSNRLPAKGTVTCLAVDAAGTLYVGTSGGIQVYGPGGEEKAVWNAFEAQSILTSISLSGKAVYVADAGLKTVWILDRQGNIRGRLNRAGKAGGKFLVPSPYFDVAGAAGGEVWVVDPGRHELVRYSGEGEEKSSWGESGAGEESFCGCCNPSHIALLPDGRFVTAEKGIVRVKRYGRSGEYAGLLAGPGLFSARERIADLATDGSGRVYVLETSGKQVRVFMTQEGMHR